MRRLWALALGLAACGGDPEPPPPVVVPVAAAEPGPIDVFASACLGQMPAFAGSRAALEGAGLTVGTDPGGTMVAQGRGIGVLVAPTLTAEGAPALGCMVGARGAAAAAVEPLRLLLGTRGPRVAEQAVREEGLEGVRWSWTEEGRPVTAELFDDPANGEAKILLTVPESAT